MAAQVGNLQVRVGADITGLNKGMAQAQAQVRGGVRGMQKQLNDLQLTFKETATFAGRSLRVLGGVWAAQLGAGAILNATDAFKQFTAQLRLATSQFGSFAQANKDVRQIAEATRSDLLSTADLYASLQRNADQFGATQAQVARVTQTVAEAFKISGASADEAANATRQLVQAFQSGRLQGDEFRSVLENAPRLARLLADSLGTTIGALRQMSKEGKLTSDILIRAFSDRKFTEGLDREFQQLPVTFDQAMSQVKNAAILALGAFDQGGQFSTGLANFITGGVKGFGDLEAAAYQFGQGVSDLFTAVEVIHDAIGSLRTSGIGAFVGLEGATLSWRDALADTLGVIDGVANAFANLYNAPGNILRMATGLGGAPINNPVNLRGQFIERTNNARVDRFRQRLFSSLEPNADRPLPPFRPSTSGKKAKGGRTRHPRQPRDRSDDVAFQFEREEMEANRAILQAKSQLAGSSEQRAAIALALLQLDHDIQDAEISDRVRRAQRDKSDGKITQAALDQVTVAADKLRAANDEKLAIEKRAFVEERLTKAEEANFEAADQQRGFAIDALRVSDQLATTAADHRKIQLEILDAEIEQKRLELEHQKQLAIRNGATAEEIKVIQDKIDNLGNERAQGAAGIIRNTQSPLEQWRQEGMAAAKDINAALESIEVQGLDGLSDALTDIITGTASMKEAFHQLAASVLRDLIAMTIKLLIFKAIQGAFGGGSVPTVPIDAFGTGNNAGFASGGYVSGPGSGTSDSIPAMLSDGEYVMSAEAVKRFGPAMLDAINTGRIPHKKGGGILGALSFITPMTAIAMHGGKTGPLALISPFGYAATKLLGFADGGMVRGLPIPRANMAGALAAVPPAGAMPPMAVVYQTFDLHGAVVTQDLLRQMDEKSQQAAQAGARMGVERMIDLNQRTFGKALG
jgi:tape measure domain-containing protein